MMTHTHTLSPVSRERVESGCNRNCGERRGRKNEEEKGKDKQLLLLQSNKKKKKKQWILAEWGGAKKISFFFQAHTPDGQFASSMRKRFEDNSTGKKEMIGE